MAKHSIFNFPIIFSLFNGTFCCIYTANRALDPIIIPYDKNNDIILHNGKYVMIIKEKTIWIYNTVFHIAFHYTEDSMYKLNVIDTVILLENWKENLLMNIQGYQLGILKTFTITNLFLLLL